MKMRTNKTSLDGLFVVEIDCFRDERGFFMESWHKRDFAQAGLRYEFVQDSHSRSTYSVLRGLHYQDMQTPIVKLVRCTVGRVFDVAVDLRVNSPTFGQWFGIELTAERSEEHTSELQSRGHLVCRLLLEKKKKKKNKIIK